MRVYSVVLLQMMIWSGYSLAEWLSHHDHPVYNVLMFLVFFYLAMLSGKSIVKSIRKTTLITMASLGIYGALGAVLSFLF